MARTIRRGTTILVAALLASWGAPLAQEEATDPAARVRDEVERMRSAAWGDRQAAEDALVALGEGAIDALLAYCDDADPEVRERVGRVLRANGGWRRVPGLLVQELDAQIAALHAALAGNEWIASMFVARRMETSPAFFGFAIDGEGQDPEKPYEQLCGIARGGGPEVVAALRDRARTAEPPIACTLAMLLAETGSSDAVTALRDLTAAWDPARECYGWAALGRCSDDAAFAALRESYANAPPRATIQVPEPFGEGTVPADRRAFLATCLRRSRCATADAFFEGALADADPQIRIGAAARLMDAGRRLHGYNPLHPVEAQAARIAAIRADAATATPDDPWSDPSVLAYVRTSSVRDILATLDDPALWTSDPAAHAQLNALARMGQGMAFPILAGAIGGTDPTWIMTELPGAAATLGDAEIVYLLNPCALKSLRATGRESLVGEIMGGSDAWVMEFVRFSARIRSDRPDVLRRLLQEGLVARGLAEPRGEGDGAYLAVRLPEDEEIPFPFLYLAVDAHGITLMLNEEDIRSWLAASATGAATLRDFVNARAPDTLPELDPGPLGVCGWCDPETILPFAWLGACASGGVEAPPIYFMLDSLIGFHRMGPLTAHYGLRDGHLGLEYFLGVDPEHPWYSRLRADPAPFALVRGMAADCTFAAAGRIPPPGPLWGELRAEILRAFGATGHGDEVRMGMEAMEAEFKEECGLALGELLAMFAGEVAIFFPRCPEDDDGHAAFSLSGDGSAARLEAAFKSAQPNLLPLQEKSGFRILRDTSDQDVAVAIDPATFLFGEGYAQAGATPGVETPTVVDRWIEVSSGTLPRATVFEPGDGFLPPAGAHFAMALNLAETIRAAAREERETIPESWLTRCGLAEHPWLRAYAAFEPEGIRIRARLDVPFERLVPGAGGILAQQIGAAMRGEEIPYIPPEERAPIEAGGGPGMSEESAAHAALLCLVTAEKEHKRDHGTYDHLTDLRRDGLHRIPMLEDGEESGYRFVEIEAPTEGSFSFMAIPSSYGAGTRRTFIVNEEGTVWSMDTQGVAPTAWPADPAAVGWTPAE